jgi:hypothetical protein
MSWLAMSLIFIIITGCSTPATMIPTVPAIASTPTAIPTVTPILTSTPTPEPTVISCTPDDVRYFENKWHLDALKKASWVSTRYEGINYAVFELNSGEQVCVLVSFINFRVIEHYLVTRNGYILSGYHEYEGGFEQKPYGIRGKAYVGEEYGETTVTIENAVFPGKDDALVMSYWPKQVDLINAAWAKTHDGRHYLDEHWKIDASPEMACNWMADFKSLVPVPSAISFCHTRLNE